MSICFFVRWCGADVFCCFAAFFCCFAFIFFFSASFCACLFRACLSSVVPAMNSLMAALRCFSNALSALLVFMVVNLQCVRNEKQLFGCVGADVALIAFRRFFLLAVDSHHDLALAARFILRTLVFHSALSCAICTSAVQLTFGSMSISMSPNWRNSCMCRIAFFIKRSSCTKVLSSLVFSFHVLSGRRRMCPSHHNLLARIQSSRLKVVVSAEAS